MLLLDGPTPRLSKGFYFIVMEKEISLNIKNIEEDASSLGYIYNFVKNIDGNRHDDNTLILFSSIALYSPKEDSELDYYITLLSSYLEGKIEKASEGKLVVPPFDPALNVSSLECKLSVASMIAKGVELSIDNSSFSNVFDCIRTCLNFSGCFLEPIKDALKVKDKTKQEEVNGIIDEHYIKNLGRRGFLSSLDSLEDYLLQVRHSF